ncbi:large conductance mechanosensitive channel protein MscL [Microbacterium hominis]|uniref:large conductance mechanosensitive channel protein MscL n=1 Tax=Microbacterium TaxID=33882 RepID=UPI00168BB744|nr:MULTISPECIES: large conductance mechanosensitive channel protein MscL [Microbacterium]QOC24978.1 large conductance mechanosensitive channel protein MscL [Microbacterium hominis]QOC29025.1 large conductance mechanosensitive channel protein MscL [Microbacterium hominis]QRY42274.1 large conductance mechanosensitive channel protein MscL [Microbacterium hominis]QYF98763.1 large conductance mechanosensitive channel protein MscL [Microbacterium sp. PAMC21962]
MIKGFKDFIMRGNVIDLAVAVVIGAAFTALVNAVVEAIINPLIALFWKADANGNIGIPVNGLYGEVIFPIGTLISAVISFLAVAVVVYFAFVVPMNHFKERQAAKAGVAEEPESKLPTEQELLIQIRDLLEKNAAQR